MSVKTALTNEGTALTISIAFGQGQTRVLTTTPFEGFLTEQTISFDGVHENVRVQSLKNGDVVVYYRQTKLSPKRTVKVTIDLPGPLLANFWQHVYQDRSSFAGDPIKSSYQLSRMVGQIDLNAGTCIVESGASSRSFFAARFGKFKEQPIGLIRRVAPPSQARLELSEKTMMLELELDETFDEWEDGLFVVSSKRLLDMESPRNLDALTVTDLDRIKILRPDGWWFTTRVGDYKGCVGDSYYPNPGFYPSRSLLKWYCQEENRLFMDIVISSMKCAVLETPESGYSLMPVVPELFNEWYGIGSNYLDTRFSTDCSRFLIQCAQAFACKGAKAKAPLLGQAYERLSLSNRVNIGRGFFLPDYIWSGNLQEKVHSSLNHVLAEINYLLELKLMTGEDRYVSLAKQFIWALEDSCRQWVRDNGDLWYGYFPHQNEFKRNDYADLTYLDLKETCELYKAVFWQDNPCVTNLFNIKRDYLAQTGQLKEKPKPASAR